MRGHCPTIPGARPAATLDVGNEGGPVSLQASRLPFESGSNAYGLLRIDHSQGRKSPARIPSPLMTAIRKFKVWAYHVPDPEARARSIGPSRRRLRASRMCRADGKGAWRWSSVTPLTRLGPLPPRQTTPRRPARRLAIDGDDIGRHTGQRRQGHKATLELLSVERRQNIAEMIVRRRPVAERPPRHVPGLGLPKPQSAGALFIRNRRHLPIAPPYVARLCGSNHPATLRRVIPSCESQSSKPARSVVIMTQLFMDGP
jgi:hypothetical protein